MGVIFGVSVVLVQCFVYHNATDISVCVQNVTGQHECCSDYKNVSGKCEECIGSFGKECANECNNGYYGHGCRYKCSCTEHFQICDSKYGCIQTGAILNDSKTISSSVTNSNDYVMKRSLLAFCGFMALLLLGIIIYVYQKLRKRSIQNRRSSANVDEQQDSQEDGVYTDVREPRIYDQCRNFDLPTYFLYNTERTKLDKPKNKISRQVSLPATRFETLESNVYDDCNRLNSPSFSRTYSSVMNYDYDHTCFKSSKSLSMSKLKDNNSSQYHKENNGCLTNQYDEFRPMMNRPYSSVKYDEQTTTDTDND